PALDVPRLVDDPHPAAPELTHDLVVAQPADGRAIYPREPGAPRVAVEVADYRRGVQKDAANLMRELRKSRQVLGGGRLLARLAPALEIDDEQILEQRRLRGRVEALQIVFERGSPLRLPLERERLADGGDLFDRSKPRFRSVPVVP